MFRPLLFVFGLMSFSSTAQVAHTAPAPIVSLDTGKIAERVCYYQDQAYSFGAIIQVGDYYMECKAANDFETNGSLKWQRIHKKPQQKSSQ